MMTLIESLAKYPVKTIAVHGQVQAYREAGQGQPLILLHGISSGSASWINQLETLSQHFHVIAWDAPGYGLSGNLDTEQPNATDYAERVLGLMDALNISKAILIGHSLGALKASAFAHLYPERVQTLIIANAAQGYQRSDEETKAQVYQKRPNMLKSLGNAGMAASRGPHLIYKQDAQALALVSEVMGQLTLDGFTRASYLLAYDEIRNYLTELSVPCVVIAGDKDGITPAQAIEELAVEMQLSRCHLITDAGHLSYVDQAEQFNDIVLSAH
ncbi:alpha/beta fold hydrolase [Acinetobacter gyllenbergii]|uniref:alpha/beta fold hydrolase n=1 Tax=Acinetobacter gyllenbergii TaxID=134534 RepID=UPI0003BF8A99|nr:alpha/beta hydrolase [Acinetobacter gyllenbergii]ESK53661.1 hypothetical protein F987_00999 [Acinetobacter gyllenbergii NIPH 230]